MPILIYTTGVLRILQVPVHLYLNSPTLNHIFFQNIFDNSPITIYWANFRSYIERIHDPAYQIEVTFRATAESCGNGKRPSCCSKRTAMHTTLHAWLFSYYSNLNIQAFVLSNYLVAQTFFPYFFVVSKTNCLFSSEICIKTLFKFFFFFIFLL